MLRNWLYYLSEKEKVTVYWLPSDLQEQQRWTKAIPRDNNQLAQTLSCEVFQFWR